MPPRNAACTVPSRQVASSTSWSRSSAKRTRARKPSARSGTSGSFVRSMPVTLKPEEQELLGEEVSAFLALLSDEGRSRYEPLASAVKEGVLPDETLEPVGNLLEAGLQTGRIRAMHRAS